MDWNSSPTKKSSLPSGPPGEEVDELALEPVRVLELVHHDGAEAPALALAHGVVCAQEVARGELEVLEVERRLALLRRRIGAVEALEQLLEQVAVAGRELVQRRLLDAAPRLLVAGGTLTLRAQLAEVEEPLRQRPVLEELEGAASGGPRGVSGLLVLCEAAGAVAERLEPLREGRPQPQLEHERPTSGAERGVHAGQHPPQAPRAVGRQEPEPLRVAVGAELRQRGLEGLALEHPRLRLV